MREHGCVMIFFLNDTVLYDYSSYLNFKTNVWPLGILIGLIYECRQSGSNLPQRCVT